MDQSHYFLLEELTAAATEKMLGLGVVEDYPDLAVRLLMADYDTPGPRVLAGLNRRETRHDPAVAHEVFERMAQEMGVIVPASPAQARSWIARHWSRQLRRGELTESQLSQRMYRSVFLAQGGPREQDPVLAGLLGGFIGLWCDWAESPEAVARLEADVRESARRLLESEDQKPVMSHQAASGSRTPTPAWPRGRAPRRRGSAG